MTKLKQYDLASNKLITVLCILAIIAIGFLPLPFFPEEITGLLGMLFVLLSIFYIVSERNLLVVIVAHAVPDILSIISSYQGQ